MWKVRETILESVTVGQVVCPGDPDRVAVYITNIGTQDVHFTTLPPPYSFTTGLPANKTQALRLYWSWDGDLARTELRAIDPAAAQELQIIEVLYWPDEE